MPQTDKQRSNLYHKTTICHFSFLRLTLKRGRTHIQYLTTDGTFGLWFHRYCIF